MKDNIIDAEDFAKINKTYKIKEVYGLENCAFDEADVVQTTTNVKNKEKTNLEECSVLKNFNKEKNIYENLKEEELKALKETIFKKFQEAYAKGQYNSDHVFVDGKRIQ